VPVGLEPVAVASRVNGGGRTEAWVVNHLSDSVSIVEVDPSDVTRTRVVRTLLVGDEPRDVVFAGTGFNRAFITTARRGQNVPATVPANLITAGTPRALVWAYDADAPGAALAGAHPAVPGLVPGLSCHPACAIWPPIPLAGRRRGRSASCLLNSHTAAPGRGSTQDIHGN
jgi:hypothetical protein